MLHMNTYDARNSELDTPLTRERPGGLLGVSREAPGGSRGVLWGVMGGPGRTLGPSWGVPGGPRGVLGGSREVLGGSWEEVPGDLGLFLEPQDPAEADLGPIWGRFGVEVGPRTP